MGNKKPKYSIIICTKDEEKNIAKVIVSIPKFIKKNSEIIVVDASKDKTAEIAKALGAKVIKSKSGKGRQLRLGVSKSKGNILIFLDGDGEHPPEYIPKMLNKLKTCDMVIGCRRLKSFKVSKKDDFNTKMRLYLLMLLYYPFRVFADTDEFINVNEALSGFRVIRKKDWKKLNLKSNKYEIEIESNIIAYKLGFKVKEVIIPTIKSSKKSGFLKDPKNLFSVAKMIMKHNKNGGNFLFK